MNARRRCRLFLLRAPWVVPTFLAAAVRLCGISGLPLWIDEGSSLFYAQWTPAELWHRLPALHQHPPLYFVLLGAWLPVGDTEALLRLPSALGSILAVPLTYAFARSLAGRRVATWAAWGMALAPFSVRHAQQARMYALLELEAVASLWAAVQILRGARGALPWAVYGLATALAPYTHAAGFLLFAALNVAYAAAARPVRPAAWLLAQTPALGAFCLWASGWIEQARGIRERYWVPAPDLRWVGESLLEWAGGIPVRGNYGAPIDSLWLVAAAGATAVVLAAGRGLWSGRRHRLRTALLLTVLLLPPASEAIVSLMRPVLLSRTFAWTLPALAVAAGLGLARTPTRLRRILGMTILLGHAGTLWFLHTRPPAEPWDWAAQTVAREARPGDAVVFLSPLGQAVFEYHGRRAGLTLPGFGSPRSMSESGSREPRVTEDGVAALEARLVPHARVWLILSPSAPYVDPDRRTRLMLRRTRPRESRETRGKLEVALYSR